MSSSVTIWLPELFLLENFGGKWETYISALYDSYSNDFHKHIPKFEFKAVRVQENKKYDGKDLTFWHLISEGKIEEERIPDLRRCERIRWPRSVIECKENSEIKVWKTHRQKNNQREERVVIALCDFSYVVVLADIKKYYRLITAYLVSEKHRQRKLKKEYESYIGEKRGGFAS